MSMLENRPTPLDALGSRLPSAKGHFRRDHFDPPLIDAGGFTLELAGTGAPRRLTLGDLRRLPRRELDVVLECAGHRRDEFEPPTPGLQWGIGAVGEARWTGAALADVLGLVGIGPEVTEVALHGADRGSCEVAAGVHRYARSIPLAKALHPDTLLVWEMDGQPLPMGHGAPLRAIVPGWYATDSVKWLERIELLREPFDGPFQALDYRWVDEQHPPPGVRMDELPVHSVITSIDAGAVRGVAWGGGGIARVDVRIDDGEWREARIEQGSGAYARALWSLYLPRPAHSVAARATDVHGESQPEQPEWNPGGYRNNSIQRIAL
jgi:DMSO/TMAO reductase YedYZ molybdopterin-dependent catalytic subunit